MGRCLEDLEATRHQCLENGMRIIGLCNGLQLLVVLRTVTGEHNLETGSITPIQTPSESLSTSTRARLTCS